MVEWKNDEKHIPTKKKAKSKLQNISTHLGSKETTILHKPKRQGLCEDSKPVLWYTQQLQAQMTTY